MRSREQETVRSLIAQVMANYRPPTQGKETIVRRYEFLCVGTGHIQDSSIV